MRANILFLGLDDTLADELGRALRTATQPHTITPVPLTAPTSAAEHVARSGADLAFCGLGRQELAALLERLKSRSCYTPVIVVSRLPDVSRWLDSMEVGAWDYCAPPFEPRLLRHMLDGALKTRRLSMAG